MVDVLEGPSPVKQHIYMRASSINRQMFNPTCVRYRDFDGHIATAKNSGTHWIKYLLSHAIADHFDLPPPQSVRDERLVGHTKTPPIYDHVPKVCTTHSQPHYLMRLGLTHRGLDLPHFVVLVRDLRAILVSLYEKWYQGQALAERRGIFSFSAYLRDGLYEESHVETLWGLIRFYNSWGAAAHACPDRIIITHYEDMKADTAGSVRRICDHVGLDMISDQAISRAVGLATRENMKAAMDQGAEQADRVVNLNERDAVDWYSASDRAYLAEILHRHLRYDMGYDFADWSRF